MRFHQNIVIKFSAQLIKILPFFLSNILVAKMLLPEQKGEYEIILLIPKMVVFFTSLGIPAANIYFVSKKQDSKEVLGNTLFLNLIITIITVSIFYLLMPFILDKFYPHVDLHLSRISLIIIFLLLNYMSLIRIFEGKKNFLVSSIYELILSYLLFILLGIIFFLQLSSLSMIVNIRIISLGIPTFLLIVHLLIRYRAKISFSFMKNQIHYGLRIHISHIISIINYRLDILLIGAISGLSFTGIYSIAVFFVEIISRPVYYIANVYFPTASSNNDIQNDAMTPLLCRISLLLTFVSSLFVLLLSQFVIKKFFDSSYQSAIKSLLILIPGMFFFSISKILSIDMMSRGKVNFVFYTFLSGFGINLISNLLLIPYLNEQGAAIATSLSHLLSAIIFLIYFIFKKKRKFSDFIIIKIEDIKKIINIIKIYSKKKKTKIREDEII